MHSAQRDMGGQVEIRNKFEIRMSQIPKHADVIVFGIDYVMKTFWSFGFLPFDIVSNFVLRYSILHIVKGTHCIGSIHALYVTSQLLFVQDSACLLSDLRVHRLLHHMLTHQI